MFDCDMCLWSPEMYELREIPSDTVLGDLNGRGRGVIGVKSGRDVVNYFLGLCKLYRTMQMESFRILR